MDLVLISEKSFRRTLSSNEADEYDDKLTTLGKKSSQHHKKDSEYGNGNILGRGRPISSITVPKTRKRSHVVFEPLVTLQRPSLQSNSSEESGRHLDANEMVDHLVNTLGLIGVSPTSTRRRPRPTRKSLQHDSDIKLEEEK